jgi:hypothetical protein
VFPRITAVNIGCDGQAIHFFCAIRSSHQQARKIPGRVALLKGPSGAGLNGADIEQASVLMSWTTSSIWSGSSRRHPVQILAEE